MKNKEYITQLRLASEVVFRELRYILNEKHWERRRTPSMRALLEIGKTPGVTAKGLEEALRLSLPTVLRVLEKLKAKEMVRVEKRKNDGRTKGLYITQKGKSLLYFVDGLAEQWVLRSMDYLTEGEQEMILKALEKYGEVLMRNRQEVEGVTIKKLPRKLSVWKRIKKLVQEVDIKYMKNEVSWFDVNPVGMEEFFYDGGSHMWYAENRRGEIIGCMGLRKHESGELLLEPFSLSMWCRGRGVEKRLLSKLRL